MKRNKKIKNRNKGMGKAIWRGIRYLQRAERIHLIECDDLTGNEYWEYWNESKEKKYSYRWVCEWINNNPNADVWTELFQADPYLWKLCEINKVTLYDQLLYYGDEWMAR